MELGVVLGVVLIGFVHGVLPDHGWPIAATYALNKRRRLLYGFLAAVILGVGHLISSVALVLAYFWFSAFAEFAEGPWLRYVAGLILILLGIHEYRNGHVHGIGDDHEHDAGHHDHHEHDDSHQEHHDHHHDHAHRTDAGEAHSHDRGGHFHGHDHAESAGLFTRLRRVLPGGGGHQHLSEEHAERGLLALGTTALLLGFAHEEPIQILAICVGTDACLELMLVYSLAVIVAIVVPTLLLIAGYEHSRDRIERLTPYLPTITAVALVGMGLAFVLGLI
ncbi:ABC transporter permease [Natrarchaeobaculum sulfurireducens]|uniref:ABC-type nickel/cobalt efflux system, permease component RcnA n=1 Tax=Natrarchaeobaculum sulfurireducens TaxID=2044521 RepID=A0A346PKW2_9EURY|nr:ABC transporter permease [Natrarchaeobaculum sulfurireducens]AXR76482.1 ABC-type nickel/cobalt efflux system, permease component RcnA [Natrarchaeobaculum sulfurireducens]AXR80157.1 Nickel transporter UreH [Natrarchaeobaculum sulfurireducens]